MRIIPDNAQLEIKCYLPNSDIGFVKPHQKAVLKIESFPFTRYGTLNATVTHVADDAIPEPDANLAEQNSQALKHRDKRVGADRVQNLVYPVTVHPEHSFLNVDGKDRPLRPGMAVTVEITTGQRRMIDYILSPLRHIDSEAMRER